MRVRRPSWWYRRLHRLRHRRRRLPVRRRFAISSVGSEPRPMAWTCAFLPIPLFDVDGQIRTIDVERENVRHHLAHGRRCAGVAPAILKDRVYLFGNPRQHFGSRTFTSHSHSERPSFVEARSAWHVKSVSRHVITRISCGDVTRSKVGPATLPGGDVTKKNLRMMLSRNVYKL